MNIYGVVILATILIDFLLSKISDYLNLKNMSDTIPDEFKDMELEIKIRPLRSKGNVRSKLEHLFNTNQDINPFEMIQNVRKWQQELRGEWE